ncbi:MAG: purine-nucleoside phosphorylase [Myxococcota bacterium]|nr:purine-nucleoside phosphorylase [Myxococcota bacterium]
MASLKQELDKSVESFAEHDQRLRGGDFVGLVLGSGLGDFVESLEDRVEIPYSELVGFHSTSVSGHKGNLCIGSLEGTTLAVMRGRVHAYEGHGTKEVVHGVRSLVHAGAQAVILTNAAGGVRPDLAVGELMLIEDHVNLTGLNPLVGNDCLELGPRFPDMTRAWDPQLLAAFTEAAAQTGVTLHRGCYAGLLGPSYETPAEVEMIRRLGGDVVGMSTVLEAIAISQMGGRIAGLSVISNAAAGTGAPDETLDHADVAGAALQAKDGLTRLLKALLANRSQWWDIP